MTPEQIAQLSPAEAENLFNAGNIGKLLSSLPQPIEATSLLFIITAAVEPNLHELYLYRRSENGHVLLGHVACREMDIHLLYSLGDYQQSAFIQEDVWLDFATITSWAATL